MAKQSRRRDPGVTRAMLLESATAEFARYGFDGARVQRIVQKAGCNMRMLYHYFENKENLYIAVLEEVYRDIREKEHQLDLAALAPREALLRLVRFTWDHFASNQIFIDITRNENLVGGRFIQQSRAITEKSSALLGMIADTLTRGIRAGSFRYNTDPLQLYISIVALSSHHMNNVHTLSSVFGTDLTDAGWLRDRREHVELMILRMVGAAEVGLAESPLTQ